MGVSVGGQKRPLRLFEVLARNRQSALELSRRTRSALQQTLRLFTIPPRQQLSSPTRLAIRRWNVTHVINTDTRIHKERERERQINIQYVTRYTSITQRVFLLTSLMQKKIISNRISAQNNERLRADGARTQHALNEDND